MRKEKQEGKDIEVNLMEIVKVRISDCVMEGKI